MDDLTQKTPKKTLPFNNLLLNSGLVNGYNSGWMYFLTLTLVIMGYSFFQSAVMFPLSNILKQNGYSSEEIYNNLGLLFNPDALKIDRNIVMMISLGMFVFAFIGFFIGLHFIHKKTLTSVLTGYEKFRFRRFWFAFLVWGFLMVVVNLGIYFVDPENTTIVFNAGGLFVSVLMMAVLMPVQAGLEEILFRGYMVQGMSQIFRNGWIPMIITTVLFGLLHMTNPEAVEYGWPIMLTYYCTFALFLGIVTLFDEGLELAFGIHFSNNFISSILVSSDHSVLKTYSIFERPVNPHLEVLLLFILLPLVFFLFKKKYHWHNFQLIIK